MGIRWDEGTTTYRGLDDEGRLVAEVTNVMGPRGEDRGWLVWLPQNRVELYTRYPTAEDAMEAAETALHVWKFGAHPPPPPSDPPDP